MTEVTYRPKMAVHAWRWEPQSDLVFPDHLRGRQIKAPELFNDPYLKAVFPAWMLYNAHYMTYAGEGDWRTSQGVVVQGALPGILMNFVSDDPNKDVLFVTRGKWVVRAAMPGTFTFDTSIHDHEAFCAAYEAI